MSAVRRIASEISDLIASGEFQPGERLREVALSERLGTSRTTIREATMVLEFQGLIRREPNRGAIVKSPSHENLKNLHACRRGLEAGAVSIPMSQERLTAVGRALRELEEVTAAQDRDRTIEYDRRFHASLVANYGSARLSDLFDSLYREQLLYLRTLAEHEREFDQDERYLDEHRHIYYALVAGDHTSAHRYVVSHIDETYARFAVLTPTEMKSTLHAVRDFSTIIA